MKFEAITRCRICGNSDLIEVLDLGEHALSGRFPAANEPDPPKSPLVLVKCNDTNNAYACGLLQLKHTTSPDELYMHHYGYRSGLNKTMTDHIQSIARTAENKVTLSSGDIVLDIGSNDATLLKAYTKKDIRKIGIDPTGLQFKQYYTSDIELLPDFFNYDNFRRLCFLDKAKIITSIAMFYDLPDPLSFVRDVKSALHPEGIWIFEQSYMPTMLEKNSFDTICHEHLEYYSLKQIDWMMQKLGMRILDVELNEANGGSFRLYVCHEKAPYLSNTKKISSIMKKEEELRLNSLSPYIEFKERIEKIKVNILDFLKNEHAKGKKIHIYGASTKGNTLLQYYGIGKDLIVAAAERNTEKFGRRTPATNIPIISEEESRKQKPDYFIVLPWHFKEEFLVREKDYLDSGGQFIFPLPVLDIIGSGKKVKEEKQSPNGKKRALITGITGQIGSYLAELLIEKGYEVYGILRRTSLVSARERIDHIPGIKLIYGDLSDSNSIEKVVSEVQPDEIYNLAAQSHVWVSFLIPENTSDINSLGVLRVCEAARRLKKPVKIYQASTSELYGGIYNFSVNELTPFYPKSPYGVSKLYAYWIMKNYRESYNMFCSNGIVFNTESPRRGENFVTRKITKSIADILKGKQQKIYLGNLNAKRDWSHAKDTANAIWMILQAGKPDDYVVASGECHSVREFVELAFKHVGIEIGWRGEGLDEVGYDKKTGKIYVSIDPKYFRPGDIGAGMIGDSSKLIKETGWERNHKFEDIVREMVENDLKLLIEQSNT